MDLLVGIGIILLTIAGMEMFSWALHKYIFHGPLWFIHKTHHIPAKTPFEANDLFSIGFALTAMILVITGWEAKDPRFWIGLGISLYGFLYFLVHDVLTHRRLKFWRKTKNRYLKAVVRAHKMHHKTLSRDDSESFGLLWVSKKYFPKKNQSA
jgi:beta-carotene 3-hydroxylase